MEMVSTFAALLFELFGKFCRLYMDVLTVSNVLTSELVKTTRTFSTKKRCANLTWQLVKGTRFFFGQSLMPRDFQQTRIQYPALDIQGLIDNIKGINKDSVPAPWLTKSNRENEDNMGRRKLEKSEE